MNWEGLSPPYATIVADPPWAPRIERQYYITKDRALPADRLKDRSFLPYSSMTLDEIRALRVGDLAATNCWLFLWITNGYLFDAPSITEAWGFAIRQVLVWHKTGRLSPFGGTIAPNHAEFLVVAAKGQPKVVRRLSGSVITAHTRAHSAKPAAFGDAIQSTVAGPYVELFARSPRLGWDSWGYGYETKPGVSRGRSREAAK